jgi:hypothetical protein
MSPLELMEEMEDKAIVLTNGYIKVVRAL